MMHGREDAFEILQGHETQVLVEILHVVLHVLEQVTTTHIVLVRLDTR